MSDTRQVAVTLHFVVPAAVDPSDLADAIFEHLDDLADEDLPVGVSFDSILYCTAKAGT